MPREVHGELASPPAGSSLMPFWFWNDALSEAEILRQIDDFERHGVHGFVIHPRVGLPRELGWMSPGLLGFMGVAIEEAARRGMRVMLYDEGMYPSGSSSGQVVAARPDLACRGLACVELRVGEAPRLEQGSNLVAQMRTRGGKTVAIIDRPVDAYIRGLHYVGEGPTEDEPGMADILNPQTTQLILELVHEKFYAAFSEHFGKTIIGIFTDEPNALGKCRERGVRPGTTGILGQVQRLLGYDFTPHLPALWYDDEPNAARHRAAWQWAIRRRMEETWYAPLSAWCEAHGVALCGHPADGDEIGVQRFFHIPGQDLVWRFVEMDKPSAIQGPESTQAKASSSAMLHLSRRLNSNEFCGAYGPQTTFEEFRWLAYWCLVRGVNLLIPHAFYYSVRGPRKDERPPQVGPHSPWWDRFKPFADACSRLCWINTDAQHICDIAILTGPDHCPWRAARACFEHQRDFNYLDTDALLDRATVAAEGVDIAGMHYRAIIVEDDSLLTQQVRSKLSPMIAAKRVIMWHDADHLLTQLSAIVTPDVTVDTPSPGLRVRHVVKNGEHFYLFFNENADAIHTTLRLSVKGLAKWIDPATGAVHDAPGPLMLSLAGHEMALLT